MAEEEVIVAPEVAVADISNKRKLEELEAMVPSSDDTAAADVGIGQDAEPENGDNAAEAKRARLEEGAQGTSLLYVL